MTDRSQGSEGSKPSTELDLDAVGRLEHYLSEHGVDHEMIEHETTMTARAEARESGVEPDDLAKAVMLVDGERRLLVVIPASRRVDLAKVQERVGGGELRVATEAEVKIAAPQLDLGALPAIGPDLPAPELFDQRLVEHERIVCNSGDHRHSVRIPPGAILDLADPIVGDFSED